MTSAIGKPAATTMTNTFITHPGASKVGNRNRSRLNEQPGHDYVRDRDLVNIAPLQFGEDVARVHNPWAAKLSQRGLRAKPNPSLVRSELLETCKEMGLLLGKGGLHGQMIRFSPPMCVSAADGDFLLEVLDRAFASL